MKVKKKKRRTNNFQPSISLDEFAKDAGLDPEVLEEAVTSRLGFLPAFNRNGVNFYHTRQLKEWLANNHVYAVRYTYNAPTPTEPNAFYVGTEGVISATPEGAVELLKAANPDIADLTITSCEKVL